MLVITAERLPLSEAPADCESVIVFTGEQGVKHGKPDPVHCVIRI